MCGIVCDIEQRAQCKCAFSKARVRHGQTRLVDDLALDPQDIDVDGARSPANRIGAGSSEQTFELEGAIENGADVARGGNEHCTVPVVGLRRAAGGRRDVKVRASDEGDVGPSADGMDGLLDRTVAVAEVCSEAEDDAVQMFHARTFVRGRGGSQWDRAMLATR